MTKKKKIEENNIQTTVTVITFFGSVIGILFYFANFFIIQKQQVEINSKQTLHIIKLQDKIYDIEKSILIRDGIHNEIDSHIQFLDEKVDKMQDVIMRGIK